jgi:ATP-dependent DNA helicase RecQ
MLGRGAVFRDGQLEAIEAIVDQRARVLVVQRTGWGKSLVYFLATRLLRDAGFGPTLLISPLLSLMRDQLLMAERIGVRAATINSENIAEWRTVEEALADDQIDLLLVSPERLANAQFTERTLTLIQGAIGLFVVDEAHCISDWGHDFRPNYRRIGRLVALLPRGVPLLATTATANDRVVADAESQLGPDLITVRGPLARESLRLQTIALDDQAERLAWLAANLPELPGSGIVYCLTIADCERVAAWLESRELEVAAYHARLDPETRFELEERLRTNDVKALVATVALGMGFDKPDLGFVVHFQRPGSPVAYYQQIGRAGRALDEAYVVLLHGREDDEIVEYFIRGAFPPEDDLRAVLGQIEEGEGLRLTDLEARLNLSRGRIEQCLKILEIDGAIFREESHYVRSANPWEPERERIRNVTTQREHELAKMQELTQAESCLMEFLGRELDDPTAAPCGRCAVCAGDFLPLDVDASLLREAVLFLRRAYRVIEARKRWPTGGIGRWSGNIRPELQAEEGRALSIYGDAGWGRLVARAKYGEERFDEELVDAAAELVRDLWQPEAAPRWVTAIPSMRTDIVPDFARRLAQRLGLPYHEALVKVRNNPPQKRMENSYQQARNVAEAFRAQADQVDSGPVLLVDDIVDSRWSMTVCAALLREAGSGPVFPLALASAAGGGS